MWEISCIVAFSREEGNYVSESSGEDLEIIIMRGGVIMKQSE